MLALHAGLLVLIVTLSPPSQRATLQTAAVLPSTVVVLLAPLPPQPKPPQQRTPKSQEPPAQAAAQTAPAPGAKVALAVSLPAIETPTSVTLPTAPAAVEQGKPTPPGPLNISTQALQSATREADKNSVRRLALQSGKIDELETATPHPIALVAAESSVPPCPPKRQLRESVGPQGYALTRDRSGDCEYERKAKVRALALGR
ncbi:MAG: hypothetical protein CFE43_07295 [Burkholderiales bacterium PBB3]|nr:MAG: hypothetical protein CFE43_07295 [Burkholderiales bacterium PBB3]